MRPLKRSWLRQWTDARIYGLTQSRKARKENKVFTQICLKPFSVIISFKNARGHRGKQGRRQLPHRSRGSHYYNPAGLGLLDLGLKAHYLTDDCLQTTTRVSCPYFCMECSMIRSACGSTIRNGAKRSPIRVIGILIVSFTNRLLPGAVITGSPKSVGKKTKNDQVGPLIGAGWVQNSSAVTRNF